MVSDTCPNWQPRPPFSRRLMFALHTVPPNAGPEPFRLPSRCNSGSISKALPHLGRTPSPESEMIDGAVFAALNNRDACQARADAVLQGPDSRYLSELPI